MKVSSETPMNAKLTCDKKLSVGIIGVGDVVYKSHLPVLLAMNDVSVAWVADCNNHRAKQVASSYGVKWLKLPEKLDALPYTDIVLLAIPYGARGPYYEMLKNRKSAIYVEKPISRDANEHRQLCSLFPSSKFAIGLQRRSWGPVVLLKNLVTESVFGSLVRIEFRCGGSAIVTSGKSFVSDAKLAGGGVLFEHGIHGLDLALYISEAKSVALHHCKTIIDKGFDVHAQGEAIITNNSGKYILDFNTSWLSETGEGFTFIFDHARIDMSITQPRILLRSSKGRILMHLTDKNMTYPITGFQTLWDYWCSFIAAIRNKTVNHTSAITSLLTVELIEQIYSAGEKQ